MSENDATPNNTTPTKPWANPKIIDIGSVDSQTTYGVGNIGDQGTSQNHWKPAAIETAEDAKAILPEGE